MLRTALTELLGIDVPIVQAGMGGVAGPALAAAVSGAGGLGTIAFVGFSPDDARAELRAARARTRRPLAGNFLLPLFDPAALDAVLDEGIEAVALFWGDPRPGIARIHAAGARAMVQVGSADEAAAAADAGADIVIAQGVEAGGHVRGTTSTLVLVPMVVDRVAPLPVVAAGGVADGRGLAAVLAAGAAGAAIGTRFLVTPEAAVDERYRRRLLDAAPEDTLLTTLFDIGWPEAPHRVLRTRTVREWEAAGRPATGARPGEGDMVATFRRGGQTFPLMRYSPPCPAEGVEGDLDALAHYAGQTCGLVHDVEAAGTLVHRIAGEARAVITERLAAMVAA